jgi:6-phosphofructokinase 1
VLTLARSYGVQRISGLRHGYRGLFDMDGYPPLALDALVVRDISRRGGTILGSSRGGGERTEEMADAIAATGINVLLTVGGDGTQKGALRLSAELERRGMAVAVVGVPKTIDNDLSFVERSFGFQTAVSQAVQAVLAAHIEARDAVRGVGLVRVMGRESGFIAAHTALAHAHVDFVLIPEVPFELHGTRGLLAQIEARMNTQGHAVVLVAEGAGQDLLRADGARDASGNARLADIGVFLRDAIQGHFGELGQDIALKYIDPGYIIRAAPAVPSDAIYCARLGANAVHAAMAGRTSCIVGHVNNRYVHVPMALAVAERRRVDPVGPLWRDVVEATGQPAVMRG